MRKLILVLCALSVAGGPFSLAAQTNEQARKDAIKQTRQDRKADKAQAKAYKNETKALKSSKVKDAAKAQDKADAAASK